MSNPIPNVDLSQQQVVSFFGQLRRMFVLWIAERLANTGSNVSLAEMERLDSFLTGNKSTEGQ
jgi:hypothetical protein